MKGEPSPARVLRWLGALLAALLATLAVPVPAVAGPATSRVVRARYLMGTIFRLEVPAEGDPSAAADSLEAALDEVQRLEEVLSNWRSDSELSRLNARAGQGAIQVSTDLFGAVESSLHWARETGGAFDPTVEPLTRRNRAGAFGTGPSSENPSGAARIRAAWRRVDLDPVSRSVAIPPGGGLDLGGIGKGIALDRAAHLLLTRGIRDALLDAGGQLLALGSPPGEEGWEVGVADPEERHRPGMVLVLRDVSLATSGNSQRPGEIVDHSTGAAVEGRYSATALARDATSADALSTALFVMAPDRGEAWASHRDDLLALYLEPAGKIGGVPRGRGTLVPPPRGRTLLITARSGQSPGSLHAEIR